MNVDKRKRVRRDYLARIDIVEPYKKSSMFTVLVHILWLIVLIPAGFTLLWIFIGCLQIFGPFFLKALLG